MGSRRTFTKEFKQSVVQQMSIHSIAELCRQHEVNQNMLLRWKKEYESNPQEAFQGKGRIWKDEAVIARYERKLGQQALEIDLLKKSIDHLRQSRAEELRMRRCTK